MSARIDTIGNDVRITYVDPYTDEVITRRYYVAALPGAFGYVHIRGSGGSDAGQVCDRLAETGNTLMATRETLAAVIRRERRRMTDAYRNDRARGGR